MFTLFSNINHVTQDYHVLSLAVFPKWKCQSVNNGQAAAAALSGAGRGVKRQFKHRVSLLTFRLIGRSVFF